MFDLDKPMPNPPELRPGSDRRRLMRSPVVRSCLAMYAATGVGFGLGLALSEGFSSPFYFAGFGGVACLTGTAASELFRGRLDNPLPSHFLVHVGLLVLAGCLIVGIIPWHSHWRPDRDWVVVVTLLSLPYLMTIGPAIRRQARWAAIGSALFFASIVAVLVAVTRLAHYFWKYFTVWCARNRDKQILHSSKPMESDGGPVAPGDLKLDHSLNQGAARPELRAGRDERLVAVAVEPDNPRPLDDDILAHMFIQEGIKVVAIGRQLLAEVGRPARQKHRVEIPARRPRRAEVGRPLRRPLPRPGQAPPALPLDPRPFCPSCTPCHRHLSTPP